MVCLSGPKKYIARFWQLLNDLAGIKYVVLGLGPQIKGA